MHVLFRPRCAQEPCQIHFSCGLTRPIPGNAVKATLDEARYWIVNMSSKIA